MGAAPTRTAPHANGWRRRFGLDMSEALEADRSQLSWPRHKAHILAAVREACGNEAAERIADMKKAPMADAAEQLLGETDLVAAAPAHRAAHLSGL